MADFGLFNETGPQLLLSSLPPELASMAALETLTLKGHVVSGVHSSRLAIAELSVL